MRYQVETEDDEYTAEGLIIATGGTYKTPGIGNIEAFENQGVSHCVECQLPTAEAVGLSVDSRSADT